MLSPYLAYANGEEILAYDKTGITITLRKQKQMPSRTSGKGVWQAGLRRNLPRRARGLLTSR